MSLIYLEKPHHAKSKKTPEPYVEPKEEKENEGEKEGDKKGKKIKRKRNKMKKMPIRKRII